ncbi:MAG TPA: hypothetical protein VF752_07230 [Thermoleophilaceae bacterium]
MNAGELRTRPRFPDVPREAGRYESFYLKASHPTEPLGFWIRHTVHKRPGSEPKGSLWFVLFTADAQHASKTTLPASEVGASEGEYIHIGDSVLTPGRARGSARTDRLDASWDLTFESPEPPLYHLPRDWMYERSLPRTKSLSPYPAARFSGTLQAGDKRVEVDGWRGMVGHNWGAEHAERWIWLQGSGFEGHEDDWLDLTIGRVRLGPLTTPWIANGAVSIGGERHRVGGIERVRKTEVAESPTGAELVIPAKDLTLRLSVGAPRECFVAWVYADPAGPEHNAVNCSIAGLTATAERRGGEPLRLATAHGAAYELGMRETDHGIPLQPFSDG